MAARLRGLLLLGSGSWRGNAGCGRVRSSQRRHIGRQTAYAGRGQRHATTRHSTFLHRSLAARTRLALGNVTTRRTAHNSINDKRVDGDAARTLLTLWHHALRQHQSATTRNCAVNNCCRAGARRGDAGRKKGRRKEEKYQKKHSGLISSHLLSSCFAQSTCHLSSSISKKYISPTNLCAEEEGRKEEKEYCNGYRSRLCQPHKQTRRHHDLYFLWMSLRSTPRLARHCYCGVP